MTYYLILSGGAPSLSDVNGGNIHVPKCTAAHPEGVLMLPLAALLKLRGPVVRGSQQFPLEGQLRLECPKSPSSADK